MKKLAILTAFLAGYVVNDVVGEFAPVAQAKVGGMDEWDLVTDVDFINASETIAKDVVSAALKRCKITAGYLDDAGYLRGMELDC